MSASTTDCDKSMPRETLRQTTKTSTSTTGQAHEHGRTHAMNNELEHGHHRSYTRAHLQQP
eukprot:1160942-Pelagomonas_calceolata.AAC.1